MGWWWWWSHGAVVVGVSPAKSRVNQLRLQSGGSKRKLSRSGTDRSLQSRLNLKGSLRRLDSDSSVSGFNTARTDLSRLSDTMPGVLSLLAHIKFDHTTKLPDLPPRGSRRFLLPDHPDSIFNAQAIAKANPKQKVRSSPRWWMRLQLSY